MKIAKVGAYPAGASEGGCPHGGTPPPVGARGGWGGGGGPWGAFGSKGSAPCRSEKRTSRTLGGGADFAGENILGRRHARKRI